MFDSMVIGYESVLAVLRRRGQVPVLKGKPTDCVFRRMRTPVSAEAER